MSRAEGRGPFNRDLLPDPAAYFEGEGVLLEGRGKWRTGPCPFHGGSDSLRVNVESGGWICMACGEHGGDVLAFHMLRYGMDFGDSAAALGAWDFTKIGHTTNSRLPLPAIDRLKIAALEMRVVYVVACDMRKRRGISTEDFERLAVACFRLEKICAC